MPHILQERNLRLSNPEAFRARVSEVVGSSDLVSSMTCSATDFNDIVRRMALAKGTQIALGSSRWQPLNLLQECHTPLRSASDNEKRISVETQKSGQSGDGSEVAGNAAEGAVVSEPIAE